MRTLAVRRAALALLCLACHDTTAPTPSVNERVASVVAGGDAQVGDAGAALPAAITVRATDADGAPLAGVQVRWAAPTGGGTVVGDTITGASGLASAQWTLAAIADTAVTLQARVADRLDVTFSATARTPATAVIAALPRQATIRSVVGQLVADTLTASVKLADGRPLANASITWQPANGGQVAAVSPRTDVTGLARARWTLGPSATTQTLTARLDAARAATFAITPAPAPVATVTITGPTSVVIGGSDVMVAHPMDAFGNAVTDVPVSWSSSSPSVATVDQVGGVKGVAVGSTTIAAAAQGVTGTRALAVTAPQSTLPGVLALYADLTDTYPAGSSNTRFFGQLTRHGTDVTAWFEYSESPDLALPLSTPQVLYTNANSTGLDTISARVFSWRPISGVVYFRLVGQNAAGRSVSAIVRWPKAQDIPPAPPGIAIDPGVNPARTTYVLGTIIPDQSGARTTSYILKRSTDGGPYATLTTTTSTQVSDNDFPKDASHTLQYRVAGCNAAGCSIDGTPSIVLTTLPLPVATNVTATAVGSWNVRVDFTRDDATYGWVGPTIIKVRRVSDGAGFTVTLFSTTQRQATIAMPQVAGVAYNFTVYTTDPNGGAYLSAPSNTATATPVP